MGKRYAPGRGIAAVMLGTACCRTMIWYGDSAGEPTAGQPATVRYFVTDLDAAVGFYRDLLGFEEELRPSAAFAMLYRGDLRLLLSVPGHAGGGSRPLPDGTSQRPGGWNRFALEVEDLEAAVSQLQAAGVTFRTGIITGIGGKQALAQDPSGNLVELFQPSLPEAREHSALGRRRQD